MPIEDYAGKDWKIIHVEDPPPSLCKDGDVVTIKQPDPDNNKVTIRCNEGDSVSFDGWYNKESNTIEVGGYEIRLVQCIKLTPKGQQRPITGSWTAEDQGPWPGDG